MTENRLWPTPREPHIGGWPGQLPKVPTPPSTMPADLPEVRAPWAEGATRPIEPAIPQQRGPSWTVEDAASAPPEWGPLDGRPPPPPPGPPRRTNTVVVLVVVGVVVALLAAGGLAWFLWNRQTHGTTTPVANVPTAGAGGGATAHPSVPKGSAASSPAGDPQAAALAQLNNLRAQSQQRVQLDGRWVAQVASKWVGITDPLQTAANGTHTFYASDILAESLAARKTVNDPSKVYVLWGTDFGLRSTGPNGAPIWVTIVDAGYASSDNVLQWCHVTYPNLTPEQLANTCAPRQLIPAE